MLLPRDLPCGVARFLGPAGRGSPTELIRLAAEDVDGGLVGYMDLHGLNRARESSGSSVGPRTADLPPQLEAMGMPLVHLRSSPMMPLWTVFSVLS